MNSDQTCLDNNTQSFSPQHKVLSQETLLRNFNGIYIPAEIWLRKDISIQSKCLWSELRSLHCKKHGGCYASEKYLMEFIGLGRSRLHEIFKELKEKGLMEIIDNDGRTIIRRAIVPPIEYEDKTYNNSFGHQVSGIQDSEIISNPENRTDSIRDPGFPSYIENKEENKEYKTTRARTPHTKAPPAPCVFVFFGSHVKLKKEDHEKLIKDYGADKVQQMIDEMNDYCQAHGKSYKDYAAALRQWFARKKETPKSKNIYEVDRRTKNVDGTIDEDRYKNVGF